MPAEPDVLWLPDPAARSATRMGRFLTRVASERDLDLPDYDAAWRWSVERLEDFWAEVLREFDVRLGGRWERVLTTRRMPDGRWFAGATVNYAERVLSAVGEGPVVTSISQSRDAVELSGGDLRRQVAACADWLRARGLGVGDRIAGYLPNQHEALVAMLATTSLGAVWSCCSPDLGAPAVLSRLQQFEPDVLIAVSAYRYGRRTIDRSSDLERIREGLPSLRWTVHVPYLEGEQVPIHSTPWAQVLQRAGGASDGPDAGTAPPCAPVPFDHPLYVLYSSGSTGPPKAIVHGHGGILLEHLKVLGLHHDLGPGDVAMWFTTTGWMMWNYLVSALLLGARVVLYDGDPAHPDPSTLWRVIAEADVTVAGMGAAFLIRCCRDDLRLPPDIDLGRVRQVGSTGSPLPEPAFRWVRDRVRADLQVASISGGTDVCTAVMGANPLVPVRSGQIQSRCLGADVAAVDADGSPVIGSVGEMVIGSPMPSMPVGLLGDDDGSAYHAAYFAERPDRWTHGDWLEITPQGGCIVSGRSDATLNRGGIRTGTAEFYAVLDRIEGIRDSLVVHVADPDGARDELILLVVPAAPRAAQREEPSDLEAEIRRAVAAQISPRHSPDTILLVPALPRTSSGKRLEVPLKRLLMGEDPAVVVAPDALDDPAAWAPLVHALSPLTRSYDHPGLLEGT